MIGRKPEEWPAIPKENQERASFLGNQGKRKFQGRDRETTMSSGS